ncbi:hypothetical protein MUG91_G54n27 [Manis pentadactyla]|nr:hypothetical protein MUG91_G54n27 [Manis pentadactyla]
MASAHTLDLAGVVRGEKVWGGTAVLRHPQLFGSVTGQDSGSVRSPRGNKETKEGLVKEQDSTWQGIVTLIPGYRLGELFMLFHIEALGIPHNVITTIKEEFKG